MTTSLGNLSIFEETFSDMEKISVGNGVNCIQFVVRDESQISEPIISRIFLKYNK